MHRYLSVFAVLAATGCGDDAAGPGGKVDPDNVKPSDLYGYWIALPHAQDETTLGFLPAERAAVELAGEPELPALPGKDTGGIWVGDGTTLAQLSEFSLRNGGIFQTVLADISALPGTEYLTEIRELVPKAHLTLESKKDPSGERTYQWFDRCPIVNGSGWHMYAGVDCGELVNQGAALVFDRHGTLHGIRGAGSRDPDVHCAGHPTIFEVTRGCLSHVMPGVSLRSASLAVGDDDIVRVVYVEQSDDDSLVYAERSVGGQFHDPIELVPTYRFTSAFALAVGGDRTVVVYSEDAGLLLATRDGSAFTTAPAMSASGRLTGLVSKAVIDARGSLWLLLQQGSETSIWHETSGGLFEALALPPSLEFPVVLDFFVAPSGKVHATFSSGDYGVHAGGTWELASLGDFGGRFWIATLGEGPRRAVTQIGKAARPEAALLTLADDDSLSFELIDERELLGPGNSPWQWERSAVAIGPNGEVAYTFNGESIKLRDVAGPILRKSAKLGIAFNAAGGGSVRVTSTDGVFDCSTDCEHDVEVGSRVTLEVVPDDTTQVALLTGCDGAVEVGDRGLRCDVIVRADLTMNLTHRQSALGGVYRLGDGGVRNNATAIGANGGRFAVAGSLVDGRFVFGDIVIESPGAGTTTAVVLADTTRGNGWATSVPVPAVGLAPSGDGGVSALFVLTNEAPFGAETIGTPGTSTLARVTFDAAGAIAERKVLVTVDEGSLRVLASDVAADGSAYVVIGHSQALAAPAIVAGTSVLYVAPEGAVSGSSLVPDQFDGKYRIDTDGVRAALVNTTFGPASITTFDRGAMAKTLVIAEAVATAIAIEGARIAVGLIGNSGSIELDGQRIGGQLFVVELDGDLKRVAHSVIAPPIVGIGAVSAITFSGGDVVTLQSDMVARRGADLSVAASHPITYGHQIRHLAGATHANGIAALFEQLAPVVDWDGIQIGGQGTQVVVDYAAP